jgi:hypothetical protein
MSNSNPFEIILVITGIMLMASATFAIIAPSLGIKVPTAPTFPSLPDLDVQGNLTLGTWAFGPETHVISLFGTSGEIKFTDFSPDKKIDLNFGGPWPFAPSLLPYFDFQRYGSALIFPWWYTEPISKLDGTSIGNYLNAQTIVNNYNGTYSTFIIDNGNKQYQAYVSFSPLPGYSSIVDSWNVGHGFTVTMYGNAYAPPAWTDQAVSYLTWFGSAVAYFVYFASYIIQMAGLLVTFFTAGFIPTGVGAAAIILVVLIFIGSILMFLRGSSGGK